MPGVARTTGKGPYRFIAGKFKAGIAIKLGNLMFCDAADAGYDKPAGLFPWTTDLGTTQAAFKAAYAGVSGLRRLTAQAADGDRGDGGVYGTGEFEFPCAALGAAVLRGTPVGPAQGAGNTLDPDAIAVCTAARAIGVTTEYTPAGATAMKFETFPVTAARP
jgi:hypothetical protein